MSATVAEKLDLQAPTDELVRIGELARRVALSPHVLRAWERRYGLLAPLRTDGGFRLYSAADEMRIREMQARIARGMAPSEAALGMPPATSPADLDPGAPVAELREAMGAFDAVAVERSLDRVVAAIGVDALIAGILIPFLREVGDRWAHGEVTVAQEHFVSGVLRSRLLRLGESTPSRGDRHAVLACPPGELHDLPLVMTAAALRTRGCRVTFLGANTPVGAIAEVAGRVTADVIVVGSPFAERFETSAREFARLGRVLGLAIGGAGASPALGRRLHATYLEGGPVQAAVEIVQMSRVSSH